jgi:hypothetical protein
MKYEIDIYYQLPFGQIITDYKISSIYNFGQKWNFRKFHQIVINSIKEIAIDQRFHSALKSSRSDRGQKNELHASIYLIFWLLGLLLAVDADPFYGETSGPRPLDPKLAAEDK